MYIPKGFLSIPQGSLSSLEFIRAPKDSWGSKGFLKLFWFLKVPQGSHGSIDLIQSCLHLVNFNYLCLVAMNISKV